MPFSDQTSRTIEQRLSMLYGSATAATLLERVQTIAAKHSELNLRPKSSNSKAHWDETDAVLITYGDSIQNASEQPLATLRDFCSQHLKNAITTIHLLPFFPYSSDDGFSVIDYRCVDSELGKWHDIANLGDDFDLMFDFVLNHVSRESLWFADFMEHMPPGNKYFIEGEPDDVRLNQVVRPRTSPLMVEIRTRHEIRYVWATFSKDQIDLNYGNPDVLMQALDILLYYIRQGARIVRLDAIAFLWKELGTSCIHLPQTHEIIKLLRDVVDAIEPEVILLTETNVPHKENVSYFGQGDEAHMVYQFSLPPLLLHAIHTNSTRHLQNWLSELSPPPEGCSFFNFTASHDGVGLRALEGVVPQEEVAQLLEDMRERGGYISTRAQADGSETPYELNISYFDALRDPDANYDKWHKARFILSQTVMMTMQGIPAFYIHSLLATPNDQQGVERTGRTRSINRRKWDGKELERLLKNPDCDASIVLQSCLQRLKTRRKEKAFHPDAGQTVLNLGDSLLGIIRTAVETGEAIKAVFNVSPFAKTVAFADLKIAESDAENITDIISGETPRFEEGENQLEMIIPAYACYWLKSKTF